MYYEISEPLQRLGFTGAHAFGTNINVYYEQEAISVNTARLDWPEKFEKSAGRVIKSRIRERSSAQEAIQRALSLASSIFEDRQRQSAQIGGSDHEHEPINTLPRSSPIIQQPVMLGRSISIKEAILRSSGRVVTNGVGTTISSIFKLIEKAKWRCMYVCMWA